jgi:hypothetical protein
VKLAVLVIGNGREYIHEVIPSIRDYILSPISARLMIDDSGSDEWGAMLDERYPEFVVRHTGGVGMAAAVQCGFELALEYDPDVVWWNEDDMLLCRCIPITDAARGLERYPEVAQMCFRRAPFDSSEGDDQLKAILAQAPNVVEYDEFVAHDFLFSLNPTLIPKRILGMGWPSGPIGVGNEDGMTARLLDAGFLFGQWGHVGDEPFAEHIGHRRGAGWRL